MIEFGTGGWRAKVEDDFTKENVTTVIKAIIKYIKQDKAKQQKIVIGYDNRQYSFEYGSELAPAMFSSAGIDVELFDQSVTTPIVMKYTKDFNIPFGIMFTASHNPAEFNGIKVFIDGRDAVKDVTNQIEYFCNSNTLAMTPQSQLGTVSHILIKDYYQVFVANILKTIDIDSINKHRLPIIVDSMYGTGGELFKYLIKELPSIQAVYLHNTKDISFGGLIPCPEEKNNTELINLVKDSNFACGFAFDSDADRLGVVDENGNFIDGNDLLSIVCWYLYNYKGLASDIAVSCCTTSRIGRIAEAYGHKCINTAIGVKYLISVMQSDGIKFAGEQNGGMIFDGHTFGKDAMYTVATVLEMLAVTGKTMSELKAYVDTKFGKCYCKAAAVAYTKSKDQITSALHTKLPDFIYKVAEISYLDGCKVIFEDGSFVICRLSGTEPIVRIMADANSIADCDYYINQYKYLLSKV